MDENFEPELVTLEDEEGNSSTYELLDTLEENGSVYYALVPVHDDPEESLQENAELIVLKLEDPSDPDSGFVSIEDDDEYERIGNIFIERLENFYDGDDEDFDGDDYGGEEDSETE